MGWRAAAFSARACSNGLQLGDLQRFAEANRRKRSHRRVGTAPGLVAVLRSIAATLPERCRARVGVVGVGRCRSSDDDRKRRGDSAEQFKRGGEASETREASEHEAAPQFEGRGEVAGRA